MKIFGIANTHFNHWKNEKQNIIKYCNRPFATIEEMNNQLIKNWNSVVNPKDYVLHFGDLKFYTFDRMDELNGKIILFSGNHDKETKTKYEERLNIYKYFKEIVELDNFVFSHYPIKTNKINFHGHKHNRVSNKNKILQNDFCFSVELINYQPVLIKEVLKRIGKENLLEELYNFINSIN